MCGYSLVTNCSFNEKNNTTDYYRGKDCFKKFCQDLKKQAKSIVDNEKKRNEKIHTRRTIYKHDTKKYCFLYNKPFFKDAKIIILK